MENIEFYRCANCGNVIASLQDSCERLICCGSRMEKLIAKNGDLGTEKHTPVVSHTDGKLTACCGSVPHPMLDNHYIQWFALVADGRCDFVFLKPGDEPKATWANAEHGAVYAYCNLHSLWMTAF